MHSITLHDQYTSTLCIEWSLNLFCITVAKMSAMTDFTKHTLVFDITRTFDVLGWLALSSIKLMFFFH